MKSRIFIFAITLCIAACGRDSDIAEQFRDDSGVLQFVPSDSAWVAVRLEPLPEEFRDRFRRQDALISEMNAAAFNAYAAGRANADGAEQLLGLLGGLTSLDGAEKIGISPDAQMAFYAVDGWPVFRVRIADEERLSNYLNELSGAMGTAITRSSLEQGTLRTLDFKGLSIYVAELDGYLVVTAGTGQATPDGLQRRLGLVLPSRNIADAGTLAELADKHKLAVAQIAHIRPADVFDAIRGAVGTSNEWLPPECGNDVRRMLEPLQSLTSGVTRVDANGLTTQTMVALDAQFSRSLHGLESPVPGLGVPGSALFAMGFSVDTDKLREFAEQRVDALRRDPLSCPAWQETNAGIERVEAFFERQPTPPTVRNLKGLVVYVDEAPELRAAQSFDLSGLKLGVVLAMKKPVELVAMGNLFLPELAALDLKPDGKSVRLAQGRTNPTGQPVFVAMSDDRLAATLGGASDERLRELMQQKPNDDAPLFWMEADAGAYLRHFGPTWSDLGLMDAELLRELESLYDRAEMSVRTTRGGLIITAEIDLN